MQASFDLSLEFHLQLLYYETILKVFLNHLRISVDMMPHHLQTLLCITHHFIMYFLQMRTFFNIITVQPSISEN